MDLSLRAGHRYGQNEATGTSALWALTTCRPIWISDFSQVVKMTSMLEIRHQQQAGVHTAPGLTRWPRSCIQARRSIDHLSMRFVGLLPKLGR